MSQTSIIKYLERFGEGTTKDMAEYLGINSSSVSLNIKRCFKAGEIKKEVKKIGWHHVNHWSLVK